MHNKNMFYKQSGEQWQDDDCRKCACVAGRVECQVTQCQKLNCLGKNEIIVPEGECCPVCLPPKESKHFKNIFYI